MDDKVAKELLENSKSREDAARILQAANHYNASSLPYKEGLEKLDIRLLGTKVDEISARGSLSIKVKRHSAKVFRLRPKLGITGKRYNHFKDEL